MKLKSITIENFRCFDHFTLTLHPQLTVLVAPNGVGKTTLLDTLRIATWPFVKAFDLASQTGKSATIQIDDVRRVPNEQGDVEWRIPAQVSVTGDWSQNHLDQTWWQSRDKIKPRTHPRYSDIKHSPESFAKSLQEKIFQQQSTTIELPLIAYLGTGRLWYQGRHDKVADSKLDKSAFSRTWGYKECLSAISSYKQFEQWFSWVYISFREQQLEALESGATFDEQGNTFKQSIDVVKKAVNALTQEATGWGDIAYLSSAQQQIVLKHPQHGVMPLKMLSDGLRNVVVMVADLAFRCVKLNPHHGADAALKTSGVVMIDEVDMFLHPSWQQTIIQSLQRAFPEIQFIVTTHSPQVLTTCKAEQIRVLCSTDKGIEVHQPTKSPYGHESADALAIMDVNSKPSLDINEKVQAYEQLVRNGHMAGDDAIQIKQSLDDVGYQIPEADLALWQFLAEQTL